MIAFPVACQIHYIPDLQNDLQSIHYIAENIPDRPDKGSISERGGSPRSEAFDTISAEMPPLIHGKAFPGTEAWIHVSISVISQWAR
jgi:hypothetical protein